MYCIIVYVDGVYNNGPSTYLIGIKEYFESWGGIFKFLRSPEIDSKESIPQTYVARRADLLLLGS